MALDYKVGDKVKSHPESSDVTGMKAIYIGEIAEVVGENDSGGCYVIHGKWIPIATNGKISDFWQERIVELGASFADLTSRQLYGNHLVLK